MKAVNLLPPDLRSGPKGPAPAVSAGKEIAGGPGPWIVLGALALCVVALAGYVLTSNTVKSRESELAATVARSEATNREAAALRPYADFQSLAQERIQTVRDLATSRFDWEQALRDLSRAMPANVTLASMKGTVSSESGGGGNLRAALNVPAIELSGCVPTQTDVATLMSRLRNVDGVTRVSLSKSDKATELQASIAGSDGTVATPACGRMNAPGFELIAFFEGAAAAATAPTGPEAQPASTTAGAAASATPAAGQPAEASGTNGAAPAATPASSTPASTGQESR
jgi:Tfp pilus assembly protein PilN